MRSFVVIATLLVALPVFAQVDTSTFSIRLFAGVDTTPPPTPSLVSITPIASTQIDIVWGAVIDDYYLAGYVLYRDDVAIATTTQTTYSDTGLSASTTYLYYVQAFDASLNYSGTSSALSTTTPNPPPPVATTSTSTSGGSGTAVRTVLTDFSLITGQNNAEIELETAHPARIEVRWGRTASYELGYIVNDVYLSSFKTNITDLEPGTTYEYEIIGYTPRGVATVLKRGQFTTENITASAPGNVLFLTAIAQGTDVRLNWQLPAGDVTAVRVVRNHLGYPATPTDGAIVYQGVASQFTDKEILAQFSPVYYTVFVFDSLGNISSGAIVRVALQDNGTGIVVPADASDEVPVFTDGEVEVFTDTATTSDAADTDALRIPSLSEIILKTETETFTFANKDIRLTKDGRFIVVVPVSAVERHLKTITLTLTNPQDPQQTYSYILRINKDATAYEAAIEPMYLTGWSEFTVAVHDYNARIISRYHKRVWFGDIARGEQAVFFPDYFLQRPLLTLGIVSGTILFLILLLLLVVHKKRQLEN